MNDDKSNEMTFGFTDIDVTSIIPEPRIECWEWCNNNNDLVLFLDDAAFDQTKYDEDGKPYPAWQDDFEPRFPDLDDHMYGEEPGELDKLRRMVSWVVSTRQDTATGEAITPVTLPHYLTGVATEYATDTAEYRLAKFKSEFKDYFELDAMTFSTSSVDILSKTRFPSNVIEGYGMSDTVIPKRERNESFFVLLRSL